MRVVLDSNVFLSALISPHGCPHQIYQAWRARRFFVVTSVHQLDEIKRASRYPKLKKLLKPAQVGTMLNNLQRAVVLEKLIIDADLSDPQDAFLLAMTRASHADYLITGDKRAGLLQMKTDGRCQILTTTQFCDWVLQ